MTDSAITINCLQPLQVSLNLAAQITFNWKLVVGDCMNDLVKLLRR